MRKRSRVLTAGIVGAATLGIWAQPALAQQQPTPGPALDTPDTAGGLPRDTQAENQLAQDIAQDREKLTSATNGRFTLVSAFYRDPSETTSDRRPAGVIFIGGMGAPNSVDPGKFVANFAAGGKESGTEVDPGPGGGRAACGQDVVRGHVGAYCGWATTDSFGLILPTFDKDIPTVSALMRRMRPDLQSTAQ